MHTDINFLSTIIYAPPFAFLRLSTPPTTSAINITIILMLNYNVFKTRPVMTGK